MKTVEIHPIQDSQALLVGWLHPYYEEMAHRKKRWTMLPFSSWLILRSFAFLQNKRDTYNTVVLSDVPCD